MNCSGPAPLPSRLFNTVDTLQTLMRQGETVSADFLKWRCPGCSAFKGSNCQNLLVQLPNCDCLLRELFMERFGLDPKKPD